MGGHRWRGLLACLAMLATACVPGSGGVSISDADRSSTTLPASAPLAEFDVDLPGLQDALDELSLAVRTGDQELTASLMDDPESGFGRRWRSKTAWMRQLPLAHYELRLDRTYTQLGGATLDDERPGADVVYVIEELALAGFDDPTAPARDDLFLTVVPTDDGWRFVGDEDAEPLGFVSVDHLWDLGPVTVTEVGGVSAIHHPDLEGVEAILVDAGRALDRANERWPLAWDDRVPILIPRTQKELGELLHVTFSLDDFIAFATGTPWSELDTFELTGSRIVLNPEKFFRRSSQTREDILIHEFIHVATHARAGSFVPSWMDEGVAQALGERQSATGTRLLDALVERGFDGVLPTDTEFRLGGRDRVFLSYQQAWSFMDHLADRFGAAAAANFYAAVGAGSTGRAGTPDWHLDRAAMEVFGESMAQLRAAWAAALS